MREAFLILGIVICTMLFFSCSTPNLNEEISIEEVSTEGEDGDLSQGSSDDEDG